MPTLFRHPSFIASALFWICCCTAHAQTPPEHTIKILSYIKDGQVWLRWAPSDFTVWQLGNKYGYNIERYTLKDDGTLQSVMPALLHTGIKPFSKERLENLPAEDDASALQELIYTEEEPVRGNGPASILQQHDDLNNRFGMTLLLCDLSPRAARAAGLFFSDTTTQANTRYIYSISLPAASALQIVPGVIVVEVVPAKLLQPFNDLVATFKDKAVTLSWPLMLHKGVYSAYIIERYSEQDKQFKSVTGLPYIPMTQSADAEQAYFVDSLTDNQVQYQYRVKGITPFGETGPPSNIVAGKGKDDLSGSIVITQAKPERNKVIIRWEFPARFEEYIGGFMVNSSAKAEGPYRSITSKPLPPKAREFSETLSGHSNYYRIEAVDAQGRELSHSYPYFVHTEDNTPPAIPVGLTGKIDSTGTVWLTWKPNADGDVLGYRLFSAHDAHHEFMEITREIITGNTFTDTISTGVLNKYIFYKIIAVDRNYNTSNYSGYLKLSRPDRIKPAAPVFSKITWNKSAISLSWINSPSSDVVKHVLIRTASGDSTQMPLLTWYAHNAKTTYTDQAITQGKQYRYVLQAHDSAGNVSTVTSRTLYAETGIREAVTDLTATINRNNQSITLRWKYAEPVSKINIYRRKNNEPFGLYQSLPDAAKEFTDTRLAISNTYSYKIQLILNNNAKTELSKELKVPY